MANSAQEWICETAKAHADRPGLARQLVREMREKKKFNPRSEGSDGMNVRELAEQCFGRYTWESRMREYGARKGWVGEASAEAVDASVFRDYFGAVAIEQVEMGYAEAASIANQLVGDWVSGTSIQDVATIPEMAATPDKALNVAAGMDYPRAGFSPVGVLAPRPNKFGLIAALTLEMVRSNQKTEILDAYAEVGRVVGQEERDRKMRVVLGVTNNYTRNGVNTNTYLTSGAYANSLTDFVLTNGPKEIDRLLQLAAVQAHPIHGREIEFNPTAILIPNAGAFNTRHQTNLAEYVEPVGTQTSTPNVMGKSVGNPLGQNFPIMIEKSIQRIGVAGASAEEPGLGLTAAKTKTLFIVADFQRAFKWRMVEPFSVFETGDLSNDYWPPAFFQDVVWACKARSWGAAFVREPRYAYRGYNDSAT